MNCALVGSDDTRGKSLLNENAIIILKLTYKVIYNWKRQPYFFLANLFLKQGISSGNVMVDFICMD